MIIYNNTILLSSINIQILLIAEVPKTYVYLINYSNNISKYNCTNSRHYLIKTSSQWCYLKLNSATNIIMRIFDDRK